MIAELFKCHDLRLDRNRFAKDAYFGRAALDRKSTRSRGLNPMKSTVFFGSGSRCIKWGWIRPPVTIPLDEMIRVETFVSLILFDSSGVDANVNPGHCRGEPYCVTNWRVSSLYSSVCFRKIS